MEYKIFLPLVVAGLSTIICIPAWIQLARLSKRHRQYFWRYITLFLLNGSLVHFIAQPVAPSALSHFGTILAIACIISATFVISEYWSILVIKKYGSGGGAFMVSNFLVPVLALLLSMFFLLKDFQPRGTIYFGMWLWTFLVIPVWMYEYIKSDCQCLWKYAAFFVALEFALLLNPSSRLMLTGFLVPLFTALMIYVRAILFQKNLDNKTSLIVFYYLLPLAFVWAFNCS